MIISTLNSWLPGDARGWRSYRHKRHSSGDYRNPPPPGEHAGLLKYCKDRSGQPLVIPRSIRATVGKAMIDTLIARGHRVLAISVSGQHSHLLVELPDDLTAIRRIIGDAKSRSSLAIRQQMPGRVWSARGTYLRIENRRHHVCTFDYILTQQSEGAWTWSFREEARGEHRL
ncbi:MAG: hypothetical protein LLG01_14615 [Planctomycetaceae bacterium]|nr:hypothetical protein [Planctomycetaceae bacterium]